MIEKFSFIKKVRDDKGVDPDTGPYRAVGYVTNDGKLFQVSQDQYGYHAKIGSHVFPNMDEGGLLNWVLSLLRR